MSDSSADSRPARQTWHKTWMNVALTMSKRSLCERDRVGSVVVSPTNRIVATGYNGPPAGFTVEPHVNMRRTSCTAWCLRAQLVGIDVPHPDKVAMLSPTYDDCPSLHAEANALMVCDRRDREGGTIYVTSSICMNCAKLIANSGLRHVFVLVDSARTVHRDYATSHSFMRRCGLLVSEMEETR